MNNRIETGFIEFLYIDNTDDLPGLYLRNEDCKSYSKPLDDIMDKLENLSNNFENALLYIELYKLNNLLNQINNPKSVCFIETKDI